MTPEDQKARDEFEAWAKTYSELCDPFCQRLPDGTYAGARMAAAWNAWQESRRTFRATVFEDAAQYLDGLHADAKGRHNYHHFAANGVRALASRPPCKGRNCSTTTANHSPECIEDHARAVAGKGNPC